MLKENQFIPSQNNYSSNGLVMIRQTFNETLSFVHQPQNILPVKIQKAIYQNSNSQNNLIYQLNITFLCDWTLKQIQKFNKIYCPRKRIKLDNDDEYCLKLVFKLFSFLNMFYLKTQGCSQDFDQYLSNQLNKRANQLHLFNNQNIVQSLLVRQELMTLMKFRILVQANTHFGGRNWHQYFLKEQLFDCCFYVLVKLISSYYSRIMNLQNVEKISLLMSYLTQGNFAKIKKMALKLYNNQNSQQILFTYIYLLYDIDGLEKLSVYLSDASKTQLLHQIKYLKDFN